MATKLTIGCDPEIFLLDNNTPVSAHEYKDKFGGKSNPLKVDGGMVQVDGTALEFGIDPAHSAEEFVSNTDKVLLQLRERVDKKLDFSYHPVQYYSKEYFATIPKEALELGCEPDYDAYTNTINAKPDVNNTFRTGSGHIHLGWTKDLNVDSLMVRTSLAVLVKQLDNILYPASTLWDLDKQRREMYGKPGAFRPKPYGLEYRVLSNAWLSFKSVQRWIFDATQKGFNLLEEGRRIPEKAWSKNSTRADTIRYLHELEKDYGIPYIPVEAYTATNFH